MRWPWQRRREVDVHGSGDAQQAITRARASLRVTEETAAEIAEIAANVRLERARNHFAEDVLAAMRRKGPAS